MTIIITKIKNANSKSGRKNRQIVSQGENLICPKYLIRLLQSLASFKIWEI